MGCKVNDFGHKISNLWKLIKMNSVNPELSSTFCNPHSNLSQTHVFQSAIFHTAHHVTCG